jgi:outer membrane protein OmpA-like peptidoglycan-associated protein
MLIEKAPRSVVLKLDPPKPGPVTVPRDSEDFPYLGHWPGAKLVSAGPSDDIDATPDNATEPTVVGPGVFREYAPAKPIGAWELVSAYGLQGRAGHAALYGIYFDVDSAKLKPESDATLQQVVRLLGLDAGIRLEIQGHTDATGERPHNQTPSEQRAASVVAYLTKAGVDGGRLTSAGFADTKPVADNDSLEGRAKSRRVELVRK